MSTYCSLKRQTYGQNIYKLNFCGDKYTTSKISKYKRQITEVKQNEQQQKQIFFFQRWIFNSMSAATATAAATTTANANVIKP